MAPSLVSMRSDVGAKFALLMWQIHPHVESAPAINYLPRNLVAEYKFSSICN